MEKKRPPIRLLRITLAALMAELIPLLILVAAITAYGFLLPDQDKATYTTFSEKAGRYIGPIVGTLATLGFGFWAARMQTNAWVLYGLLTGALVVMLDLAIFATPKADFDLADVLILLAKLLAGTLGGYLAQRRYQNLPPEARESHRII